MRRLLWMIPAALLFWGCASDEGEHPLFVTDAAVSGSAFSPGDEVTITARGFDEGDEIMLDIRWPLTGASLTEGYARGVWGIITARTASSITFLAPGHYPSSTVEIFLRRAGRMQSLGRIAVSDGRSPERYRLYGIVQSDAETRIERIDPATGEASPVKTLAPGQGLACAVNVPGSNSIYGVSARGGNAAAVSYDLTMRYYRASGSDHVLIPGRVSESVAAYLLCDAERLTYSALHAEVRANNTPLFWFLPEDLTPSALGNTPFVFTSGGFLLLVADYADGTFAPVALDAHSGRYAVYVAEPVQADAMVPFRMLVAPTEGSGGDFEWVGGYAVASGGKTVLRLLDPASMTFEDTVAEVTGTVVSVTEHVYGADTKELYLLCDSDGAARQIRVCDMLTGAVRTLPGAFDCTEIVMVR